MIYLGILLLLFSGYVHIQTKAIRAQQYQLQQELAKQQDRVDRLKMKQQKLHRELQGISCDIRY